MLGSAEAAGRSMFSSKFGCMPATEYVVDFGAAQTIQIEAEGNGWPVSAAKENIKKGGKRTWTMQEMIDYNDSDIFRQTMFNSILHSIEKARARATSCGTSQPPLLDTLDDGLLLPPGAPQHVSAMVGKTRIWDTGASKGMTRLDEASGAIVQGPKTKVVTGAGVIDSSTWVDEITPMGAMRHIGLANTANTLSAGQANQETGTETSWLAPREVPSTSPGQVVLHKAVKHQKFNEFNHVVWSGVHEVLVPTIVANTPEVGDGQSFEKLSGTFCATTGCPCKLPKLADRLSNARGLPGQVPEAAEAAPPGEAESEDEGVDDLAVDDPYAVDSAKAALHSLSGHPCSCPICIASKQRRKYAKRLSHPHSEQVAATTPGLHTQSDMPTYFDVVDYGGDQKYNGNCRYDIFGVNPSTGSWIVAPSPSKSQEHVEEALKSLHAPGEDLAKLVMRSDRANELTAGIRAVGSFADPTGPYRPNSNKAERAILTFSDTLRVHFIQSGLPPAFRPLVSIAVAQYFNLLKAVKRVDTDGVPFFSTPYKLRHGAGSVQVDLSTLPMIGQLVSFVPAEIHQSSYQRCGPRGVDAIYWF